MSEFSRLRDELEQLESARAALLAKLETARAAEQSIEIEDIKKRIVAFNIKPEQLFPDVRVATKRVRKYTGNGKSAAPPVYALDGNTWHGKAGPKPKWVQAALAAGHTLESMRIQPVNGAGA